MIDYKQIVRKRATRFLILRLLKWVPDNIMLRLQYRLKMDFWPDFKHPKRFTEKLQLYKMEYRNPLMPICVDKYRVREYVKSKGLESILNELYGVYDRAEDIPFDKLPNEYVVKTTDGSGGNNILIVDDVSTLDIKSTIPLINSWIGIKDINAGREWAYTGIDISRIIVERKLGYEGVSDVKDYKFFCFSGEPYIICVDSNRFIEHERSIYDINWKQLDITFNDYPKGSTENVPINFDYMLYVARMLSKDFPFVRVDLYNIEGDVVFGELTFYPSSGYCYFNPDSFDFELGSKFDLRM